MIHWMLLAIALLAVIVFAFQPYFLSRKELHESKRKLLLKKYYTAREKRILWREERTFDLDFNDPEYQEL